MTQDEGRQGLWYALGCYGIWGMFPLYWYPLNHSAMAAEQVLAHRIVWSALFAVVLLLLWRRGAAVKALLARPRQLALLAASACLIGINWLTYLWAMVNSHVLDASLGYLVNPLFNVFLGWLVFKEKLQRPQWLAVAMAAVGVLWLAVWGGSMPWVPVLLALSFGGYGLMRKLVQTDALTGLVVETLVLLPMAAAYLWWCAAQGKASLDSLNTLQTAVLFGSGVATTLPLLLFAAAVRRIPLSLMGMLQYGSPILQLLLALFVFNETLDTVRLAGYIWVCIGVAVYLVHLFRQMRAPRQAA